MFCPKCGTNNTENNEVCSNCGYELKAVKTIAPSSTAPPPSTPSPAPPIPPTAPAEPSRVSVSPPSPTPTPPVAPPVASPEPASSRFTYVPFAGVGALVGGAIILVGWFMPWFRGSGLVSLLGRFMGLGGGGILGNLAGGLSGGSSVGNGLQVAVGAFLLGFGGLFSGTEIGALGLLVLIADAVFVAVPVLGVLCIRNAWVLISERQGGESARFYVLSYAAEKIKSRVTAILVIQAVFFVVFALIPLGLSILGGGFYVVLLGALVVLASALYVIKR